MAPAGSQTSGPGGSGNSDGGGGGGGPDCSLLSAVGQAALKNTIQVAKTAIDAAIDFSGLNGYYKLLTSLAALTDRLSREIIEYSNYAKTHTDIEKLTIRFDIIKGLKEQVVEVIDAAFAKQNIFTKAEAAVNLVLNLLKNADGVCQSAHDSLKDAGCSTLNIDLLCGGLAPLNFALSTFKSVLDVAENLYEKAVGRATIVAFCAGFDFAEQILRDANARHVLVGDALRSSHTNVIDQDTFFLALSNIILGVNTLRTETDSELICYSDLTQIYSYLNETSRANGLVFQQVFGFWRGELSRQIGKWLRDPRCVHPSGRVTAFLPAVATANIIYFDIRKKPYRRRKNKHERLGNSNQHPHVCARQRCAAGQRFGWTR